MTRPAQRFSWIVGLIALAAALDFLPIGLPAGTELLLGPYVYMPIVVAATESWAMAAVAIAMAPTLWGFGHPFLLITAVLEAGALVAARRTRLHAAVTDFVFWAVVGAPLGYALYSGVTLLPSDLTTFVVLKQAVNQWTAVVLAHFLTHDAGIFDWLNAMQAKRRRIRDLVFDHGLVLALIPLLLVGIGMSVMLRRLSEDGDRALLSGAAQRVADQLDLFLLSHEQSVQQSARLMAASAADPQVVLEQARWSHPAFITLLATDRAGTIVAAAPVTPVPANGLSVRDREYFQAPRRGGNPHVSGVFRGRGFGTDVLVAVSAPILGDGDRFDGVVEGSLEVNRFGREVARAKTPDGLDLILADPHGRVIYADPATGLRPLDKLQASPVCGVGTLAPGKRFVFDRPGQEGRLTRYVAFAATSSRFNIMVIAQRPLLAGLASVGWIYALIATLMVGMIAAAVLIARLASQRLSRPLEDFSRAAVDQATRSIVEPIPLPTLPAPAEAMELFSAFNALAEKLHVSHRALRTQNAELDRRVAERTKELEAARQAAEQADRSKSDFLAMTSHEIRTPLNAIIGLAEVSIPLAKDPEVAERLGTIGGAGKKLLDVVNDLLDLSKIEAGKLETVPEPVDLAQLCREVETLFSLRAAQQRIALRLDYQLPAPLWVSVDGGRLRQVLVNLIGNALKFTGEGTVTLHVESIGNEGPAVVVHFAVADTGPGIPAERQARLFEPYSQLDQRQGVGTGLGLSISRRIVELLGGELQLHSEVGRGSRFFFTLTLPRAAAPAAPVSAPPVRDVTERSILVADDNLTNQEIVRAMLEPHTRKLVTVGTAAEAIDCLARERFDVALIDLEMPDADGFSVAAAVRRWHNGEASRECRLIAFSAYPRDQLMPQCARSGFDDFLSKPVDRKQLMRLVAAAAPRPNPA